MEEADLLKERLQAITDKRRVQEGISNKRTEIDEEKLKLQYIKKKALREQWLMDGLSLSQQTEEEEEALRLQVQDEREQSVQLQNNIDRIDKEIVALEMQELDISDNEKDILRRLKEVERTPEDIIKKAASESGQQETDGTELSPGCNESSSSSSSSNTDQLTSLLLASSIVAMDTPTEPPEQTAAAATDADSADSPAAAEPENNAPPAAPDSGKDPSAADTEKDPSAADTETLGSSSPPDSPGMKTVLDHAAGAHLQPAGTGATADEMDDVINSDTVPADMAARTDAKEALVLEEAPRSEELNRNESVASDTPSTPSSTDSVIESEAHRRRREQDPEILEAAGPDEHHHPLQPGGAVDPLQSGGAVDPPPDSEPEVDTQRDPEHAVADPPSDPEPETDPHPDSEPETDPHPDCNVERAHRSCHHELEADPHRADSEPDIDCELDVEPEAADHDPGLDRDLEVEVEEEDPEADQIPFEPRITETVEELTMEQYFLREEAMSDFSDEVDECLRVEIAAVSSDSDTNENEKWRSMFSSSINKEDDDSYVDSLQLSAQELFVQKVEMTDTNDGDSVQIVELPLEEDVLEQPDDNLSFPSPPQEVTYNPLTLQVLSRISEDGSESGKDSSGGRDECQQHLVTDLAGKKLPKDFCVIQETANENVSTEHVDFRLARKQWLEMEEQTKNRVVLPTTTRQPVLHGSHSFMYTPVRNVERPHRKAHELESLTLLGDYTQFSPCSEDSGLDDSSYRSPYDDPETPIEKEIRMALERENDFRKERGIPRSTSTPLTPSFIITSSPAKVPTNHNSDDQSLRDNGVDSNLITLGTSSLIVRSSSDYCLNKACEQPQEKMFLSNPFFKLRSRSTLSLVDEEIRMARQREEELRKERACLDTKDTLFSQHHMEALAFHNPDDVPVKCKSSPSSPMKTACKMDRSTLSCDHRFPEVYTGGRRKSALALRWEAGEFIGSDCAQGAAI